MANNVEHSSHGDLTAASSSSISSPASDASEGFDSQSGFLNFVSNDGETAIAELGERLELAVGGEGVIGKMISITSEGLELGDGIIGWN